MKLLRDESIPRTLATYFPDTFDVKTVSQMGWAGTENGVLLRLAADHDFDALITADQGVEHQQNLAELPIPVVVMIAHRTRVVDLAPLVPRVIDVVEQQPDIEIYRVVA